MRTVRLLAVLMFVGIFALPVNARPSDDGLNSVQTRIACAVTPPAAVESALRVAGGQDTMPRSMFGPRDLIVISGGTTQNVQIGQEYFVRRDEWFGVKGKSRPHAVRTAGWIKIVAASDSTAVASVEHACGAIAEGDYLEPFVPPAEPASSEKSGELDFKSLGRVMHGDRARSTAGIGDFMLIDRGADEGAAPGARFAVYRDLRRDGLPLASIGEAVVVTSGPSLAVIRITQARDAVVSGDYIVPRR